MENRIDPQILLNTVIDQRNEALNKLAQMTAYARQLENQTQKQANPEEDEQ